MKKEVRNSFLALMFLTLTCVAGVSAQTVERISDPKPLVSEPLAKLEGAVTWKKYGGEWTDKAPEPSYLELRTIEIDGVKQMMLITQTRKGAFEYPAIQEGYYRYTASNYFLFDKKILSAIVSETPEFNKSYGVDFEVSLSTQARVVTSDAKIIADKIYSEISFLEYYKKNPPAIPVNGLRIGVFPVIYEGKKKVRFVFREGTSLADREYKVSEFEAQYFEIEFDKFYKFFRFDEPAPKPEAVAKPEPAAKLKTN